MTIKKNYIAIALMTIFTASAGSLLTSGGMGWYDGLRKPEIAPDGSIIGSVWTIIFILAAISAIMFWNAPRKKYFKLIVFLFLLNAILNILWSFLFFTLHLFWWSIAEMIILNAVNLALILLLWKYERISSLLLMPYFLWVSFATYLAYLVASLN